VSESPGASRPGQRGQPCVSVVIPCFDAGGTLAEAIASCLGQTYTALEVIVVDDGSADNSCAVAARFGARITLARSGHRGGCAARNMGIALSRGRYLQFLDADDWISPCKLEDQVRHLEATGADAVYGDWRWQLEEQGRARLMPVAVGGCAGDRLAGLLSGTWWVPCNALLYRRSLLERIGGWDECLHANQDGDLLIRALQSGAAVDYAPGMLSVYRSVRGRASVAGRSDPEAVRSRLMILERAEAQLVTSGAVTDEYQRVFAAAYYRLARAAYAGDRRLSERCLQCSRRAAPNWRPGGTLAHRVGRALVGFERAQELAGAKRQAGRLMRERMSGFRAGTSGLGLIARLRSADTNASARSGDGSRRLGRRRP